MKRTRSWQYLWRLTKWRELYFDLHSQPFITCCQEIDLAVAKALFDAGKAYIHMRFLDDAGNVVGQKCKVVTLYKPMEVEVDPHA